MSKHPVLWIFLPCGVSLATAAQEGAVTKDLNDLFSAHNVSSVWKRIHCDLDASQGGVLRATFWKGYETTGFETTRLSASDWSAWKSFRFDVENPYPRPVSVYVRISNQSDHPAAETYTGGTFDGFVVGPGQNTVEISLEKMRSREEQPVDPKRIAYLAMFFQPLFLRDGMDLKFTEDQTLHLSNPRLSVATAVAQKQPYGDLLFRQTAPNLIALRKQVEQAVDSLRKRIEQAKVRNIETAYA